MTRGQLAALIAIRLGTVLDRAPKRPPSVATDIRTHWAAESIVRVTQAGVMDVSANHTFQPGADISRGELAIVSGRLIPLALADRATACALKCSSALRRRRVACPLSVRRTRRGLGRDEDRCRRPLPADENRNRSEVLAAVARLQQLGER